MKYSKEWLKNEQPYIKCNNVHERNFVEIRLNSMGFNKISNSYEDQLIIAVCWSSFYSCKNGISKRHKTITATEFLNDK